MEVDLAWPKDLPVRDEEKGTGELIAEVSAQVSTVDVVETGVSTEEHCGGLVVLRWKPGLDGTGWFGGLKLVEKALRCDLLVKTS